MKNVAVTNITKSKKYYQLQHYESQAFIKGLVKHNSIMV